MTAMKPAHNIIAHMWGFASMHDTMIGVPACSSLHNCHNDEGEVLAAHLSAPFNHMLPLNHMCHACAQPFGKVPVLEDTELGVTLFESRSILRCGAAPH